MTTPAGFTSGKILSVYEEDYLDTKEAENCKTHGDVTSDRKAENITHTIAERAIRHMLPEKISKSSLRHKKIVTIAEDRIVEILKRFSSVMTGELKNEIQSLREILSQRIDSEEDFNQKGDILGDYLIDVNKEAFSFQEILSQSDDVYEEDYQQLDNFYGLHSNQMKSVRRKNEGSSLEEQLSRCCILDKESQENEDYSEDYSSETTFEIECGIDQDIVSQNNSSKERSPVFEELNKDHEDTEYSEQEAQKSLISHNEEEFQQIDEGLQMHSSEVISDQEKDEEQPLESKLGCIICDEGTQKFDKSSELSFNETKSKAEYGSDQTMVLQQRFSKTKSLNLDEMIKPHQDKEYSEQEFWKSLRFIIQYCLRRLTIDGGRKTE